MNNSGELKIKKKIYAKDRVLASLEEYMSPRKNDP